GDERADILEPQRRENDLLQAHAGASDLVQAAHQGMAGIYLIVAIGADEKQRAHIRLGREIGQQRERRRVEPLQVVEEQRQGVVGRGEYAEETPEHQPEARLRLVRRKIEDRRLFADDELELGDEVQHQLRIAAQRVAEVLAPPSDLCVAL